MIDEMRLWMFGSDAADGDRNISQASLKTCALLESGPLRTWIRNQIIELLHVELQNPSPRHFHGPFLQICIWLLTLCQSCISVDPAQVGAYEWTNVAKPEKEWDGDYTDSRRMYGPRPFGVRKRYHVVCAL